MTSTDPPPAPGRARSAARRVLLPLAALCVALSACTPGDPPAEPDEQETAVQSSTPEPSPSASSPAPEGSGTSSPAPSASSGPASSSPSAASTNALLTISIRQDDSSEPVQYVLECVDGVPGPASTHPNPDAACETLTRIGTAFFTARRNKDVICTQQYGGPQTASITGELDGTPVVGSFALTDGCQISRWNSVADLLGAPGAQ